MWLLEVAALIVAAPSLAKGGGALRCDGASVRLAGPALRAFPAHTPVQLVPLSSLIAVLCAPTPCAPYTHPSLWESTAEAAFRHTVVVTVMREGWAVPECGCGVESGAVETALRTDARFLRFHLHLQSLLLVVLPPYSWDPMLPQRSQDQTDADVIRVVRGSVETGSVELVSNTSCHLRVWAAELSSTAASTTPSGKKRDESEITKSKSLSVVVFSYGSIVITAILFVLLIVICVKSNVGPPDQSQDKDQPPAYV